MGKLVILLIKQASIVDVANRIYGVAKAVYYIWIQVIRAQVLGLL